MRTEFKREMNRNYMILRPETDFEESYTLRMLSENRIPGLLPFQEKRIDGEISLYFDITSRQSLARMMEYRPFQAKEIRRITGDLILTLTSLERFLVDGDQLCLEPDLIYVEPDRWKTDFCMIPGTRCRFEESFRKLARYILDHVDHTDGEAVILAFALFKAGEKGNLGIRDLETCLRAGEEKRDVQILGKKKESGGGTKNAVELYGGERGDLPERQSEQQQKQEQKKVRERYDKSWAEPEPARSGIKERNRKSVPGKNAVVRILIGALMILIPAALLRVGGPEVLLEWRWGILAAEGALAAGMILTGMNGDGTQTVNADKDEEDWEIAFKEEEQKTEGGFPGEWEEPETFFCADRNEKLQDDSSGEGEIQTVLLTGRQIYPATRRLIPENGGEEIEVRYFPFIIGKNKEIADVCLNVPQISRIHAKIEESGDGYLVTDLNSTNGTSVDGRLLETNESASLKPGQTVSFADQSYRFV